jgi:hypothetical protein
MDRSLRIELTPFLRGTVIRRGAIFGGMLVAALLAFEIFNYATTAFALSDILGNLQSAGLRWSTVLALAFCGIDFAGIARLFTPQRGQDEVAEVWYLFGAWLLAAGFNAALTWWGVSVAIASHTSEGSMLLGRDTITHVVPVLVAIMVWVIRVLIIGTFSLAGESLFTVGEAATVKPPVSMRRSAAPFSAPAPTAAGGSAAEPSYHPVGMSARSNQQRPPLRQ